MSWRRIWAALIWPLWTGPRWAWSHLWPILKDGKALHLALVPWAFVALVLGAAWAIPKLLDTSGNAPTEDPFLLAVLPLAGQLLGAITSLRAFNFSGSFVGPVWHLCALYAAFSAASFSLLGPLHVLFLGAGDGNRQNGAPGRGHGSARWGRRADAARAGCLRQSDETEGLVLGRLGRRANPFIARHHVITVAPTRTGKGVSCVIPTALTYPGSMFIFDPKGEVHAVTQAQRKRMQGRIARIDPFGVTQKPSHSVNWLSCIDVKDRSCVSASASLANAIIARGAREDSHWDDQAEFLIQGLILYVATLTDKSHMGTVREMLTSGEMDAHCETMKSNEALCHGVIARRARSFMGMEAREKSGVLSTAQRHTAFLDDPCIVDTLQYNDVDFQEMKYGSKPITLYLVLPPDRLKAYARFVRATLNVALSAMVKSQEPPKRPVVFLLDEFAQLGRCPEVEEKLSIIAGYGVWFWLFLQDMAQLQKNYGSTSTFLENAFLQVFAVQGYEAAKAISDAVGVATMQVSSTSRSSTDARQGSSTGHGTNTTPAARMLATPDEVMRLDRRYALVFANGVPAFKLSKLDYLVDRDYKNKAAANPFYRRSA